MTREEEIAEEIFNDIPESEREFILNAKGHEYVRSLIYFGRAIRNTYGLWDPDCELTFKHPEWEERIIDGVDYNPRHPDAVSSNIMRIVLEKIGVNMAADSIYDKR